MKILFCTNAFQHVTNGPAKFANLVLEINDLYPEHQIRILTEDITEEYARQVKSVYPVVLRIPAPLKPLGQVIRMFQYYKRIRQIRKEFDYDVLVYNNAFTGLYASIVSQKPTAGMINDEKNLTATWSQFSFDRWWLKRFIFRTLEKRSARYHHLIITNSDYLTGKVRQTYKLPAEKVRRLYKAIDMNGVRWNPDRTFGEPIRILFVKADFRTGRLDVLVKALSLLDQYRFQLTVIGPEAQFGGQVDELSNGIANTTLSNKGPQPQREVYKYLQSNDIFCVPSATEALGVANIEALAAGIPVISTRVGGIPEVLDQGRNGWLVETGNARELADAIRDCIENEPERLKRSGNGKVYIQRFSKEKMLTQFLQILENTCG
jgi:glycosyltransferase involved in cell wall biosynthesis